MTVLAMDGGSRDGSRELAGQIAKDLSGIVLMDNPRQFQGCAVNLAVRSFPADYYLWLGAHTLFPEDYLLRCLETQRRTGAAAVGGVCETVPGDGAYGAQVVQALTTHRFGVGNSGFRVGAKEGPADTVPYALFAQEIFSKAGYLDERLVRAQDYEFNRRLGRLGMKIWLNPQIRCRYQNQASFWKFLRKQIFLEAPYNAYMWYLAPYSFQPRHAITGLFAAGFLGGLLVWPLSRFLGWAFISVLALYGCLAVGAALQQGLRYRSWRHVFTLPACFFLFHFGHGLGVLHGLVRLAAGTAPVQKAKEPWEKAGFRKIPRAWFQEKPGERR